MAMGNNGVKFYEPSPQSIKKSNKESDEIIKVISDLKAAIMIQDDDIDTLKTRLDEEMVERANSAEQVLNLTKAINEVKDHFDRQFNETNLKIESINGDQQEKIDTMGTAIKEELQGQMANLRSDIGNQLETIKADVKNQIESIKKSLESIERKPITAPEEPVDEEPINNDEDLTGKELYRMVEGRKNEIAKRYAIGPMSTSPELSIVTRDSLTNHIPAIN